MKILVSILIIAVLGLAACSNGPSTYSVGEDTNSGLDTILPQSIDFRSATADECPAGGAVYSVYIDQNKSGVLDIEETVLNRQKVCNGSDGQNGADGHNGMNAVFQVIPAPQAVCPNGGSTILMAQDAMGTGVYSALDPGQQSATICNGTNGADGTNGHDATPGAYTIMEPIAPCGYAVSYKEVLLRMANGQILASFSDNAEGKNTRFAFLSDGAYANTDGSGCNFSLATSIDGKTRSISWFGQVQQTWSLP